MPVDVGNVVSINIPVGCAVVDADVVVVVVDVVLDSVGGAVVVVGSAIIVGADVLIAAGYGFGCCVFSKSLVLFSSPPSPSPSHRTRLIVFEYSYNAISHSFLATK